MDVFAYDEKEDEIWAIQCKNNSPDNRVGVGIIRELLGSLKEYPDETKGMVVTTSSFSKGAYKLADRYKVKLVTNEEFFKG